MNKNKDDKLQNPKIQGLNLLKNLNLNTNIPILTHPS